MAEKEILRSLHFSPSLRSERACHPERRRREGPAFRSQKQSRSFAPRADARSAQDDNAGYFKTKKVLSLQSPPRERLGDFFSRERVTVASSRRHLHPHPVRPHATRDPRYPLDPPPYLRPNHNRHHHQSPRDRRSRAGPKWHRRPGRVGARLGERSDLWGQ